MKTLTAIIPIILCLIIVLNLTSCFLIVSKDNGKHNGWYKNSHNPNHTLILNQGNGHHDHGDNRGYGHGRH